MPEITVVVPPVADPPPDPTEEIGEALADAEEDAEEIDELSEQLAVHSIISEERHEEILERVNLCQTELEKLSATGITSAENPLLLQVLAELAELKGEIESLKSSMVTTRNPPTPNESIPAEEPAEPNREKLTGAPSEEGAEQPPEPPSNRRRNRFI